MSTPRRSPQPSLRRWGSPASLTAVWVPDAEHEALRELVRCREAAKADQPRARHRLSKLLLRHGIRAPKGMRSWSHKHELWLRNLRFEQPALEAVRRDLFNQVCHQTERITEMEKAIDEAIENAPAHLRELIQGLQALRGVATLTAATLATELGDISRFRSARQLMSYAGLCPREYSSGGRTWQGGITKSGNSQLRRIVIEAAWSYRYPPNLYPVLKKRQAGTSDEIKAVFWKAQPRLHQRYRRLLGRGKAPTQAATAVLTSALRTGGLDGRKPGVSEHGRAASRDIHPTTKRILEKN
jgi:transposase